MKRCAKCNGTARGTDAQGRPNLIVADGLPLCRDCIADSIVEAELRSADATMDRIRQTYAWRLMHGDHGGRTAA